jgi:hypothetical protein
MEGMALGPLPVRTLASLAAHREDAQKYTGLSTGEGKAAHFFHGTKLPISLETKVGGETNRGTKLPFRRSGEEENWAGKAPRGGPSSLRLFGRGNDDVWYGQAARGAASPVPDGTRASRSPWRPRQGASGSPVCLRSKPECGFVSRESCSRLHLRSRIQMLTRGEAQHGPHPLERGAAAPHGMRLGPVAEGIETKAGKCKKTGG